jgi:ketosteroid isomerase-like protein
VKKTLIWVSLGLFLLVGTAWPQSSKSGGTEQAVADLEHKWLESQRANSPDAIAPYIADKAVITTADGKARGKADFLKEQKATKYSSVDYSDVKVTAFGDTAIATGLFKGKGTDPAGKSFDVNERFTDTWIKMPGGKWQCVASQSSPVKM